MGAGVGARLPDRLGRTLMQVLGLVTGFVGLGMARGLDRVQSGPMAIVGSLQNGLALDPRTLVLKASLDGIAAVALAGAYGVGVGLSTVPIRHGRDAGADPRSVPRREGKLETVTDAR